RGLGVVAFDRYNIPGQFPYDVERFVGDIRDYEAVQEAVNKVDYVVNLAGILGTQETIRKPIPSIQTNIVGTLNVLEAMVPNAFHEVQGVQIGVGNYWMNNSYSITKSTAIRFCKMYNKENGTKMGMVRALNAYGRNQKHKPVRKIIPTFVVKALRGEDIEVYGDGEQIMDMVHVTDVAKVLLDVATGDNVDYQRVYEAGTGRKTTVNWIAEQVIKAAGTKSQLVHIPMRPGEPKGSVVLGDPSTLD
ncbi:unnamed protein product, partial [marine sediment metagenome]